ncbi:MAG: efflux RND transporter periplasmic adaptor subunit [Gammaproteobacteria bacterium]|nr:efflux RND transporter periplasmic adaptor subunit [Gammaproteobacteria bacterium]
MKNLNPIQSLLFLSLFLPLQNSAAEETLTTEVAVQVARVQIASLNAYLDGYGIVAPEPAAAGRPAGAAYLTAPVSGLVLEVPVSEGEQIKSGDLVIRLDDRLAKAELKRAQARVRFAQSVLKRERTLLKQHNTSQKTFEIRQQDLALARADLANAEGVLAQRQLRSSLDGVVSRVNVLPGQAVDLNTVLAEIVDLNRLIVSANIPTADIEKVKLGQTARILISHSTRVINATVTFISPSVNPSNGTVLVRLALPPHSQLRPGQFVKIKIAIERHQSSLVVPLASVYTDIDGVSSLSSVKNKIAHRHEVELGLQEDQWIEVKGEALHAGMMVVTVGSYALPDNSAVRRIHTPQGR